MKGLISGAVRLPTPPQTLDGPTLAWANSLVEVVQRELDYLRKNSNLSGQPIRVPQATVADLQGQSQKFSPQNTNGAGLVEVVDQGGNTLGLAMSDGSKWLFTALGPLP
jgi:hypothetical protein